MLQILRPLCWLEHMSLDNETGLDPPGIRVRPVSGLAAADYFALGYSLWAVIIENLVRDQALSKLKSVVEFMVKTHDNRKVVVIPHSMGGLYFLHFMKWVEAPAPMGDGGGSDWCARHIKAVMNIGTPFLGVPKAFAGLFSAEANDFAAARAMAPGVVDMGIIGLQALQHAMHMTYTWDSTMSVLPKGGETVWGDLDWSPEEEFICFPKKYNVIHVCKECDSNNSCTKALCSREKPLTHYGRIVSFGKMAAELPSSELMMADYKGASKSRKPVQHNISCGDVWTEYHEMNWESVQAVAEHKVYTAETILDLLRFVAPKMMKRGDAHFSYGIADNLNDSKYGHYKYWSNPLETT